MLTQMNVSELLLCHEISLASTVASVFQNSFFASRLHIVPGEVEYRAHGMEIPGLIFLE